MHGKAGVSSGPGSAPGRVRRVAARGVAVVLAIFWGWLFFGLQDFATPLVDRQEFALHLLMETGWGLLYLVLVAVPLAVFAVWPGAAVPLVQVLVCSAALALGAVAAGSATHVLPAVGLSGCVALLAVLAGVRPIVPFGRPAPVSAALTVVAAVPAVTYAWRMARGAVEPELTWGLDHYPVQAAFSVSVVLTALLAAACAARHEAFRWLPALTAAFCAAWMGVLSTLWPHRLGSFGTLWGWAAVIWGGALLLAVTIEGRRVRGA